MKENDRLKPCPFCGKMPQIDYTFGTAVIQCVNSKCGLKPSTWLQTKNKKFEQLVKTWNTRGYEEDLCPHNVNWDDCPDGRH